MKNWIQIISIISLLSACGSSDSGNKDSLNTSEIQQISQQLDALGFGDLSSLTQDQIDQIKVSLKAEGLSTNDINAVFTALNIGLSTSGNSFTGTLKTGFWKDATNNQYLHISGSSFIYYQPINNCYIADLYTIEGATTNQLSLLNNDSQQAINVSVNSTSDYAFSMTPPSGIPGDFEWSERATIGKTKGCETTKTATIEIDYRDLPSQIKLNDASYSWDIYFDINKNNTIDSGDIRVSVRDNAASGDIIDIEGLSPQIWLVSTTETDVAFGSSRTLMTVPFEVDNTTMTLTINDSYQSLIRFIDSETPIYVETTLIYNSSDTTVFGSNDVNKDGPWSWSTPNATHSDRYPETGYVDAGNGISYTDSLNDQIGEAGWIDINTLKITIELADSSKQALKL